jgi:RNA polymerase sigma-70 factor, ECF subfamily
MRCTCSGDGREGTEEAPDSIRDASDAQLAVGIARRRPEALTEAHRRYAGSIFRLAKVIGADTSQAGDILQEVFVTLWNGSETADLGRESLRAYLLSQAHRRAVDALRTQTPQGARLEMDRDREVEGKVMALVSGQPVGDAIASLQDVERRAIVLSYFGGHSYQQVATLLDQDERTVKSGIHTGLQRLGMALEQPSAHIPGA